MTEKTAYLPEPDVYGITYWYAKSETVTKRTRIWEYYEARCVGADTPEDALAAYHRGEGARITGKRRIVS